MGILIVDDANFMRQLVRRICDKYNIPVVGEAENGLIAVEKYKELQPSLVTMDITMPEMDGIQAVKEIMKYDPSAIIIMCSAMGQKCMVIEAVRAGAKDFIVKPFQEDKMIETLKKYM